MKDSAFVSTPEPTLNVALKIHVVRELKTIFGDCKQFILTGSIATALQGFDVTPKDIDIVLIEPSEATIQQLLRHVKDHGLYSNNEKLIEKKKYFFNFHNQTINVFVAPQGEKLYDEWLTYDGIIISNIMRIVEAKKSYHRLKDHMQLKGWAKQIFDKKAEEKELETIFVTSEYPQ